MLFGCQFRGHRLPKGITKAKSEEMSHGIFIDFLTDVFTRQTPIDHRHGSQDCWNVCAREGCAAQHMRSGMFWGDPEIDGMALS